MNTQTIPSNDNFRLFMSEPEKPRSKPFLEALNTIEYGTLTLITPDGKWRVFAGSHPGPAADWQVYDWRVFDDFVARGELGFADAYIDGRWDSRDLEALITFGLLNTQKLESFFHGRMLYALWTRIKNFMLRNSLTGSRRNIIAHYDLGNDFYRLWLDQSMTYSCALFEGDENRTLEEAQQAKYARILRRLDAQDGEHILEIGCGWGGFAEAAAKRGMRVTGITLADTQATYARQRMKRLGLDDLVSIELIDYRNIAGRFDHVVSIGMFEHVGEKYWPAYFKAVRNRLRPGGRAMIQSIIMDENLFEELGDTTGFMEHYIFPGGMLPSLPRFCTEAENAGLNCREIYSFGQDYAITLARWRGRFEAHLEHIKALGYDESFIRLWRLYLTSSIASFKSRRTDVMQIQLS